MLVNRIWQWHFGIGIVDTANDFGANGGLPSHPELLDWLASELVNPEKQRSVDRRAWSVKHIHRLIVLSSTYRQASKHPDVKTGAVKIHRLGCSACPRAGLPQRKFATQCSCFPAD